MEPGEMKEKIIVVHIINPIKLLVLGALQSH